jgi:hypothetical protein
MRLLRVLLYCSTTVTFVLTCCVYVRSYWDWDHLRVPVREPTYIVVMSARGVITLDLNARSNYYPEGLMHQSAPLSLVDQQCAGMFEQTNWDPYNRRNLGFSYRAAAGTARGVSYRFKSISFPYWLFLVPLAVLPGHLLLCTLRARSRRRRGLCVKCGYDLRHSTSEVCSECGTPHTGHVGLVRRAHADGE